MFQLLINFKTGQVVVFPKENTKNILVKFASNARHWSRPQESVLQYKNMTMNVEPSYRHQDSYVTRLSDKAVAKVTADMTPVFMSKAYQKNSPRGSQAFLQEVNKLQGNGLMKVVKVKSDDSTTYECKLYNTRGTATLKDFHSGENGFGGQVHENDLKSNDHKPKLVAEFATNYKAYQKATAFKKKLNATETEWSFRL